MIGCDLAPAVEQRVADVAAEHDRMLAGRQHRAGQCRGGRLAVCPRDADYGSSAQLEEESDLARDGDVLGARLVEQLRVPRNAGAGVHHVDTLERAGVIPAQPQFHPAGHLGQRRTQLLRKLAVNHSNLLTFSGEVLCKRDAAARRAYDQGYQTCMRTRAIAAIAETSPAPQKESAMRFSDQPSWWNV